jgi:uroporphyrinogen-III synthase
VSGQFSQHGNSLAGCTIVITRPAGTASSLARRVRTLGGTPLLLPGLSLHAVSDRDTARAQWQQAHNDDVLIFTSPAAVRYAMKLAPLATHATVIATGQGTSRALRQLGIEAQVPTTRQDSEGVLALSALQSLQGRRVALITAPDGRGILQEQLAKRGAVLREVHVYTRGVPRLNRRHVDAVMHLPKRACVLFSSAEAMRHLLTFLPVAARDRLRGAVAIASSERIAELARLDGFSRVETADSAHSDDLLATACKVCSRASNEGGLAGC